MRAALLLFATLQVTTQRCAGFAITGPHYAPTPLTFLKDCKQLRCACSALCIHLQLSIQRPPRCVSKFADPSKARDHFVCEIVPGQLRTRRMPGSGTAVPVAYPRGRASRPPRVCVAWPQLPASTSASMTMKG